MKMLTYTRMRAHESAALSMERVPPIVLIIAMIVAAIGAFAYAMPQTPTRDDNKEPTVMVEVPSESSHMYDVPSVASIRSIEAETFGMRTVLSARLPDVPSFAVPASHWQPILDNLRHPKVDVSPRLRCPAVGRLKITHTDGTITDMTYYWYASRVSLHYSIRGVRCYDDDRSGLDGNLIRDGAMALDYHIRDAYLRATGRDTSEPITEGSQAKESRRSQ